jgi:hypothetical protein
MNPSSLELVLKTAIEIKENILVVGGPGIGKTEIGLHVVCDILGYECQVWHPVVDLPEDYKGFPFVIDGKACFMPFDKLEKLVTATKPLVVLIDDLGQAQHSIQAPLMQVVQAREINGLKISDFVSFIACTNRRGDKAAVQGIIEPLKSRFCIVELDTNVEDWTKWARIHGISSDMIAFINISERNGESMLFSPKPSLDMTNTPCPRLVVKADNWMKRTELPLALRYEMVKGCCGETFVVAFRRFKEIISSMPDPQTIINNPLTDVSKLESSVLLALCGAIAFRANEKNLGNIVKFCNNNHLEYSNLIMSDITTRVPALRNTLAYSEWAASNQRRMS